MGFILDYEETPATSWVEFVVVDSIEIYNLIAFRRNPGKSLGSNCELHICTGCDEIKSNVPKLKDLTLWLTAKKTQTALSDLINDVQMGEKKQKKTRTELVTEGQVR